MNKWEYTTIGEHCIVTSSKRFHISDRSTTGVPFYCSKEIIQKVNGEDVSDCDYIKEESYENVKVQYGVPERGDLLITTRGTYGIPYIYRDVDKFYFADGNLTWLKNFDDELLVKYLYYWILSYEGQKNRCNCQRNCPESGSNSVYKIVAITFTASGCAEKNSRHSLILRRSY